MDYYDDETFEQSDRLIIDNTMRSYLDEYGKWGKILAIISFAGIGLGVAAMLMALIFTGFYGSDLSGDSTFASSTFMIVLSLVLTAVYIFPALYLYRSSESARIAVQQFDETAMNESLRNLRNLFKFMGILTLAMIAFYILIFFIAVLGGFGFLLG